MKKEIRFLIILLLCLFSFVAGGLAYRAGFFSSIKREIINPLLQISSFATPESPTAVPTQIPTPKAEIDSEFEYQFLTDISHVSMNGVVFNEADISPLKFLIGGHLYGNQSDEEFHPAMTFISNLGYFRNLDLDMMFFLGDVARNSPENDFDNIDYFLLDQINVPVFNSVGNHDMKYREDYLKRYGQTVFAFIHKSNLFIVLDTTIVTNDLSNREVDFVKDVIGRYSDDPNIENIHIFMHHVLFLEDDEITGSYISSPNAGKGISERFRELLNFVIYPASNNADFYLYAGDVGAYEGSNLSPFYKKSSLYDVTFIATGIGNWETDSVIFVEETSEGIKISPYSLTGQEMNAIEYYNFEYWRTKPQN